MMGSKREGICPVTTLIFLCCEWNAEKKTIYYPSDVQIPHSVTFEPKRVVWHLQLLGKLSTFLKWTVIHRELLDFISMNSNMLTQTLMLLLCVEKQPMGSAYVIPSKFVYQHSKHLGSLCNGKQLTRLSLDKAWW